MRWMPADNATSAWMKFLCTRYEIARSLYSDANTCLTASSTLANPWMLRNVSCWPANDASGRSSAVADERTATDRSPFAPCCSASYARLTSCSSCAGNGWAVIQPRISAPAAASALTSSTSSFSSLPSMRFASPPCARKSRYACAVVAKPPGTRTPPPASWPIISPSEAFLPPMRPTSCMRSFSKGMTYDSLLMDHLSDLCKASKAAILPVIP